MRALLTSLLLFWMSTVCVRGDVYKRAAHHHHHPDPAHTIDSVQPTVPLSCFGHHCHGPKWVCLVNKERDFTGRCEGPEHCDGPHHACTTSLEHVHGPEHDCCCTSQACIDSLTGPIQTTQHLNCFGQLCDDDFPICLVNKEWAFTGRCEKAGHHCDGPHHACTTSLEHVHGPEHECCCTRQACIDSLSPTSVPVAQTAAPPQTTSAVQATTPIPLHCPVCTDGFVANCPQNAVCASNEGCMLVVTGGKLQTGCHEIINCEFLGRIGYSICCKDKQCIDDTFRHMHESSFTCPTCVNSPDPYACYLQQHKCSYLTQGCTIHHNQAGLSSGCNTHPKECQVAQDANSPLCHIHPIPFTFQPELKCSFCCHRNESTCILDALGIHDVTPTPTSGHSTGTAGSTCYDVEDATFNCQNYNTLYGLCSHTSGLMGQLVSTKCRKTCGQCGGGGLPTVSHTLPPTTHQPPPCIDHDLNNNCVTLTSILCQSQDVHTKNFAIANCAKTCNLCTEYYHHLAGLTITFAPFIGK